MGRVIWEPTPESVAEANVSAYLDWLDRERGVSLETYASLWEWSTTDLRDFWASIWDYYGVDAASPPDTPLERTTMPGARWFPGARLNYAEHVLARAPTVGPALLAIAEGKEPVPVTSEELRAQVGSVAAVLREWGVGPGDRVAAYVGNLPEAVVSMLAVTSIGAIWTVCAPDFGTKGVLDRFVQVEPSVLIAVDGYRFGGREHDRLGTVRELKAAMPGLKKTILIRSLRPDDIPPPDLGAVPFDSLLDRAEEPDFRAMDFEDPLWILYSSGTTGAPKGIVQGHGGILLEHLKSLGLAMDLRREDRYFFYSSTSWMAWNYLVGGLLHGTTIVLYDGSPAHPEIGGNWRIAAATGATTFGTGSAYVSGCSNAGLGLDAYDLGSLRTVIPTGSPLPPAGWEWLVAQLPGVRIDPIAGGTDVCTAFTGGSPLLPVRVGEIPCRWPGVAVDVFDGQGRSVRDEVGEFVVTEPMPSMPTELWNDPDGSRYRDTYFADYPGVWRQGDWASISADGGVTILGRSDATLNRGGVRIGSAEIYASVERHPEVIDSLVVGVELPDGGYAMPMFIVLSDGADLDDGLRDRIRTRLRSDLSPRHVPDVIVAAPAIPRTLTGKKLEVPIKRILQGVPLGEAVAIGVVDRPEALDWYVEVGESRQLVGGRS